MLILYRLLFLPALLAMAPHYLRRMRRRGGYGENFAQRFGSYGGLPRKAGGAKRVWIQAVSVGEVLAVAPIVEALHKDGVEVFLTTTTSTGYRLAHDKYFSFTVGIGYFPLDWWLFSARAWRAVRPDLVVLTEGERWPEHARQARRRRVPVIGINARLSDRSFRRLKLLEPVSQFVLGGISRLLPCSPQDEARFLKLGYPREQMSMLGNIKLDVTLPPAEAAEKTKLRAELGVPTGLILLGASTWPGEEEALLGALRAARSVGLACSLVLVPRHVERRFEIERTLLGSKLRFHLRSRGPAPGEVDVAVGDTTGELRRLLQVADLVFVGKSLPPHTEGQTPVEAAALGKPLVFGPGMGNFRDIARDLLAGGAARQVADAPELAAEVSVLLRDAGAREALAKAALRWREGNAGAVDRTLGVIREELGRV